MKRHLLILLILLLPLSSYAWKWWPLPMDEPDTARDTLLYYSGFSAVAGTSKAASLMWQMTHGEISEYGYSGNLSAGLIKPATRPHRWWDADGAVVLSGRVYGDGHYSSGTGYFSRLYGHVRLAIVDVTVGIQPMYSGPSDPELSIGSWLFSANAHPIPRITVGLDRWTSIPGLFGYAEVKGALTHGWMEDHRSTVSGTKLHHAYVAGKAGGNLPVNATIEFHHAAQWGGYSSIYGDLGNSWNDFKNVVLGRNGGNSYSEQMNAQGNHIIMQVLSLTGKGHGWSLTAYWENIMEDGSFRFMGAGQNATDGLWGLRMEQQRWPYLNRVTLEFLNATDQSGPIHDRDGLVFGGNDCYYANGIYTSGWTYYGRTIGCAALTPTDSRVMALQLGVTGDIYGYQYQLKAQHARHLGTYNQPQHTRNTALMLDIRRHSERAWGLDFGLRMAADIGTTYGNQFSMMLTVSKQGLIWKN